LHANDLNFNKKQLEVKCEPKNELKQAGFKKER